LSRVKSLDGPRVRGISRIGKEKVYGEENVYGTIHVQLGCYMLYSVIQNQSVFTEHGLLHPIIPIVKTLILFDIVGLLF